MWVGGYLVPFLGVVGMLSFSVSMFFNAGVVMMWLYLELCGLSLIPLFFSGGGCLSFSGLFYYIVFSGVSSCLILMGLLLSDCAFFLIGGFLLKFGIFPLWGWVYRVCSVSNWAVVWGLSTILKISIVVFPFFLVLSFFIGQGLVVLCGLGCLWLSLAFWVFSCSWKVCWCHMMLSSSSVLVALSLSGCSIFSVVSVFFAYFFWASGCLWCLSSWCDGDSSLSNSTMILLFSLFMLTLPVSFSIFYKALVCSSVFVCGLFLMLCWCVYSISEQFYLFLFLTGLYGGKSVVVSTGVLLLDSLC